MLWKHCNACRRCLAVACFLVLLFPGTHAAADPPPLTVWDGKSHRSGVAHVSAPASPPAAAVLQPVPPENPQEGSHLALHLKASRSWIQARWYWADAATSGTDISSGYTLLRLRLRVTGSTRSEGLTLALGSGGSAPEGQHTTASVRVRAYAPDFADTNWHTLSIPLTDLTAVSNGFDPTHADTLALALWAEQEDCTVEIAEITFTSLPLVTPPVAETKPEKSPVPPTAPQGPPPPPGFEAQWKRAEVLKTQITEDMNRSLIENAFLPPRDGGRQSSQLTRYYMGNEVMVEVTYDQTGGSFSGENRVRGPLRIYRSGRHDD